MSHPSVLLVNQSIGPLFSDIVKSSKRNNDVTLFEGCLYARSSFRARLISWSLYSIQLVWHLILRGRLYSSLLVVSNPPFAPLLAPLAFRPYCLLLYDLYPQVLAQLHPLPPLQRLFLSLITSLWHSANRYSFSKAEYIFTLSGAMADQLKGYFPSENVWRKKVLVIPPWADTETMQPNVDNAMAFRQRHSVSGLLITYSGNLGLTHPLEILLQACGQLERLQLSTLVHFFIIGRGAKLTSLQQQSKELRLSETSLRFFDPLPYEELSACLSAADLAVVALDGPSSNSSLPSKTFNALACGTPLLVLAPFGSAIAQLVEHHKCGFVIQPDSSAPQRLSDLLVRLAANPEELQALADNALAASSHFTSRNASNLVDKWLSTIPS